ncbi:MAG TPA: hypothetical protein VEJ18_00720 [Planctomycetota bacterium]|nr:hypothetical protein [Planctomycetota bacterium]
MATMTYSVHDGGRAPLLVFRADFSRASSPLLLAGEDGESSTPFQAADARHRPVEAAKLLDRWLRNNGGGCWERGAKGLVLRRRRDTR